MEKYCRACLATDGNITRRMRTAFWVPKARHTHTHTHTMCISYFFSTATVFARTWLNVTLCVYCLCWVIVVPSDVAMRTFDVAPTVTYWRRIFILMVCVKETFFFLLVCWDIWHQHEILIQPLVW